MLAQFRHRGSQGKLVPFLRQTGDFQTAESGGGGEGPPKSLAREGSESQGA